MDFYFGDTPPSVAFFQRHDDFYPRFNRLLELCNKCFSQRQMKSIPNQIYFRLGITCRTEFFEILFLAINGYAMASTKLLRGLYERAATLAYLLKHPAKVKRFLEFSAVNEHKLLQEARKQASDAELNALWPHGTIADIEQRYQQYKGQFERPGGKKLAPSWDTAFAAQVQELGTPFSDYYLTAYLLPTLHVHATLTSIMPNQGQTSEARCDLTLMMAHAILLKVMDLQNTHFQLSVDQELDACGTDFRELWKLNPQTAPGSSSDST